MTAQHCHMPTPSREQLLQTINEVSFAVNDAALYLDTHPTDTCAMEFLQKNLAARKEALAHYASHFGPLTIDTADDACSKSWEWIEMPFPWEQKGGCR